MIKINNFIYFSIKVSIIINMKSGIYKITNIINGKFYIGSSKNIDERWDNHKQYLRGGYHGNPKLQNAWNKYGEDKFIFEILEHTEPTQELLFERENYYILLLKPYERKTGYNICIKAEGGDNLKYHPRGKEIIQSWKDKYSVLYLGEGNPMFGKKHKESSINLQKNKSIGRFTLDWFMQKYGENNGKIKFNERNFKLKNRKINYFYENGLKGKKRGPMSDEIKKRISERKAKLKVIREDLHKDILSNLYTMKQLSEKYGTSMSTIKNEKKKVNS